MGPTAKWCPTLRRYQKFGTRLKHITCHLEYCYHGLKICSLIMVMLPQRSHGVIRNHLRCYYQPGSHHSLYVTASMHHQCRLTPSWIIHLDQQLVQSSRYSMMVLPEYPCSWPRCYHAFIGQEKSPMADKTCHPMMQFQYGVTISYLPIQYMYTTV